MNQELVIHEPTIHPVLRVKPITKAIWNIYGPPQLALFMLEHAFEDMRWDEMLRMQLLQGHFDKSRKANFKSRR